MPSDFSKKVRFTVTILPSPRFKFYFPWEGQGKIKKNHGYTVTKKLESIRKTWGWSPTDCAEQQTPVQSLVEALCPTRGKSSPKWFSLEGWVKNNYDNSISTMQGNNFFLSGGIRREVGRVGWRGGWVARGVGSEGGGESTEAGRVGARWPEKATLHFSYL